MVTLQLRQLVVQPGQRIQLQNVDWAEFEAILEELGDRRPNRIAYFEDLVKIFLEELDIDNEGFGSSTFKRSSMSAGIEPDECFYIRHAMEMRGKDRVDLAIDPPPDLAIEVDVTSVTGLEAYQALGVPELWRFEEGRLRISVLRNGTYQDSTISPNFPQFEIIPMVEQAIAQAKTDGRNQTLKAFRKTVRNTIVSLK